ncbi:MAG: DJ-1/PfpI/YhbO family deglycase/protease [Bacillota bacterium]
MWRKAVLFVLAALFTTIVAGGCGRPETARPPEQAEPPAAAKTEKLRPAGELAGKKVLLVVAPRDFRDEEFSVPRRVFEEQGAQITVASSVKGTATGMLGGAVEADVVFSEVRPADFSAVVLAGGTGSKEYLWDDKELRRVVQGTYQEGKVVSAICLSPVVLARAGCLKGKEATVWPDPAAVRELKTAGAKYVDRSVVVSGSVATARDPQSAEAFAQAVAGLLERQAK